MKTIGLFAVSTFLLFSVHSKAHKSLPSNPNDSTKTIVDTVAVEIQEDNPVLVALDDLWLSEQLSWSTFDTDTSCLNIHGFSKEEIPEYPDSVIAARLYGLNAQTPMNLDYNRYVKAFINLYTNKRRDVTSRVLGLAELYYPMFEEKLDQFDIPLELKHLAVVESALNPSARSHVGATGLWQFMYSTGKIYDLNVTSYTDDRRDPYKSTVAACRYMQFLYGMYGDWNLVLAAYNSGPGNVNKAIRRSGGHRDYWKIRPYLPRETRGYVPAFIAVNYTMNFAAEHNLYPVEPLFVHAQIDTLNVCQRATFDQISHFTGVEVKELEVLNPSLKKNIIPESKTCHTLYIPSSAVGAFLANEDSLYEYQKDAPQAVNGYVVNEEITYYKVRSGDVLGVIAERNGVTVTQIREWNNLRSSRIYPGQRLEIHSTKKVKVDSATAKATEEKKSEGGTKSVVETSGNVDYYTIRSGDTLWDIAKTYPGVTVNDIKRVNTGVNYNRLKPGQKIKIPKKS